MVVRLEERTAAVAAPEQLNDGSNHRRVCTAAFEGTRYVFYAVDSLVVVLHENHSGAIANNPRSEAKRSSQFDLWQVWNVQDAIRCVRFNTTSKRVARGALAVCLDEGRVVLMTPTMATSHLTTAAPPPAALTRTASRLSIKTSEEDFKPVSSATRRSSLFVAGTSRPGNASNGNDVTAEYVKVHLHLQLPTWQESIRWKADNDRLMDRLEWVESGDDLWLVGAGEKITTWKLDEESGVVAYQQLSFSVGEPEQRVWHMDTTHTGRFMATAGQHDRIAKLWSLTELAHDGTPVCLYLAHKRALVSVTWTKHWHTYKIQGNQLPQGGHCEMLFTLDRAGTITIWRENIASPSRSFTLWKAFNTQDFLLQSAYGDIERVENDSDGTEQCCFSPIKSLALVANNWGRSVPRASTSFTDALLGEDNVMAALSQFHYGYTSLDDVRRSELLNQRMDGISKVNAKLLGARSGMAADSHAGEAFICGNAPLNKTFVVNLACGVHENGDMSLFRIESVPFSVSAPRVSLICVFSGLRNQLAGASVYIVCSADYKDRENGISSFLVELLYQPRGNESQLKVARLKLQAESGSGGFGGGMRSSRSAVTYSVQMCEVGDASPSVMSAYTSSVSDSLPPSITLATLGSATPQQANISSDVVIATNSGQVDILWTGSHLGDLQVGCRASDILPSPQTKISHTVAWPSEKILFAFTDGRLHATNFCVDSVAPSSPSLNGTQSVASIGSKLLFRDDDEELGGITQLILCGVSASQKKAWSAAPTSFFFSAAPSSDEPTVLKDFCVVIGLQSDQRSLVVWVFSMEPPAAISTEDGDVVVLQTTASPMQLFRRVMVEVPENRQLLCIAATPSLNHYETLFASVDDRTCHTLSLWGFHDMDDLSSLRCVHASNLAPVLQSAVDATTARNGQNDAMRFFSTQTKHEFRELAASACGRAALLFEEQAAGAIDASLLASSTSAASGGDAYLCIVSLFDTWHESVVSLPLKKYGQVVAIQWTPPRTPSHDCQVVFLTATAVGIVCVDASASDGAWHVAWTSTRLTAKPRLLSDMARFPQVYVGLGTGIADLNLGDLMGTSCSLSLATSISTSISTGGAAADAASSTAHPLTLLFLLMRGSFPSLDRAVAHIKQSILDHEKTCYLKMLDDQEMYKLMFMPLETLLGNSDDDKDERSVTYTKGKGNSNNGGGASSGSSTTVTSRGSLARASDLFAMDFGSVRRSSLALGLGNSGGLDNLFGTAATASGQDPAAIEEQPLGLETNELPAFFADHKAFLTFLPDELRGVFLDLIAGSKKIISWEKDTTRVKDEATLRFAASLLWPYKPPSADAMTLSSNENESTTSSDAPQALHNSDTNDEDDDAARLAAAAVGICSEQVAWAVLNDCETELLQTCFPSQTMTLQELTQLRLPFWLKSYTKLAQFTEKAAQAEFAATRDPFRVALLYILLGKTKLLVSLFKMSSESKIADLLTNDFSDPRWKNAAVKNAYVLKAKRRHELSAAFFVLGGKVQEAMAVAEHADRTLVLSFLIARLSEKWDMGSGGSSSDSQGGGYNDMSFTGLSTNLRTFSAMRLVDNNGDATTTAPIDSFKDVCKEYLKTTVWSKAQACGDVYMSFLVKYLLGETASAFQALVAIPEGDVTCMFDATSVTTTPSPDSAAARGLYWRVFGQSLLGAAELVRHLRPTLPRMTSAMKLQVVHLQAIALNRLFAMGFNTIALYHQRDFATPFQQFCKENVPQSSAVRGALLAARSRILASVVSGQSLKLSSATTKSLLHTLTSKPSAAAPLTTTVSQAFEDCMDAEIQCLITRGGGKSYSVDNYPETSGSLVESTLKTAVLETLHQSGRTAIQDFLFVHWNQSLPRGLANPSPIHHLLESVVDGVAAVAAGDLVTSATTQFHSKYIDQISSELLDIAENLLAWLAHFFHGKRPSQKETGTASAAGPCSNNNAEYIRVVTAAVYSIICVCCRYVKTPCCVYRALNAIFPHMDALPKKTLEEIKEIALADVCVHCSAAKPTSGDASPSPSPSPSSSTSSLQRDIPVLYQIVQMVRQNLNVVVEEVRTNRLELAPPMLFFSYCQYWTLVVSLGVSRMPAHVTKVAVDGANPHSMSGMLAKNLVQVWTTYATNLAKYSSRILLCELTESYFRPFNSRSPSTPTGSTPGTPKDGSGSTTSTGNNSSSATSTGGSSPMPSTSMATTPVISPRSRESRQLLRCTCDRCPWLLLLKMFADKDELLLRINSQLECCSEKIKEEISWGHLPDFPSKKAALTRSQKILLSAAATGKSPEISDLLEKRMLQSTPSIQLVANCIYRSEVSIKSVCFNRATETAEMVLCTSRGISRTSSVEYSDGTKYQFKGMYAYPHASPSSSFSDPIAPMTRRKTSDMSALGRSAADSPQRSGMDGSGGGGGANAASGTELKTPSFKPTAIESHPFLPLFVSGNQKGKVHLWSYESLSSVCEFQTRDVVATYPLTPALSSRGDIKEIHFDNLGQHMGAVDKAGRLLMWKFANLDREACYRELSCHDKGAKALQFINSSSMVATAGSSSDKRSVCMWDLLLPNSKAQIAAPACHPAGAASLTFSPSHQLLISGGEGGSISVFDVRQRRVLHTISNAHETAITTLELHPSGRCVLSGSASGDVKIWSLPIFRELVAVSKVHAKPSFLGDAASNILGDAASNMAINVTNSSWGVTDAFATDDYFFTSGTDGSVQRFRVPSLGKLM